MWDIALENRLWFSTEPGAGDPQTSTAIVTGPILSAAVTKTTPLPRTAVRPGRLVLWRAAARMFAAHPVFGAGPDNFRLEYGPYSGILRADPRIHTNDMYIEMFAGGGIVGGAAFLWLMWRAAGQGAAALRVSADARLTASIGVAAAVFVVLLHGFVDSFLGFTPTYVLIAFTFGCAAAASDGAEAWADANRV
jgi:O-antigen ligase